MRCLVTLALTMAFSFSAQARKAPKFEGQLLTYGQMMSLSSAKRMKYLKDVTEILSMMEMTQRRNELADASGLQELKEKVALMMNMMAVFPQAEAAEPAAPAPAADLVPRWGAKGWECTGDNVVFDPTLGTCALQRTSGGLFKSKTLWFSPDTCPEGTIALSISARASRKCVPETSWSALSPERRFALLRGERYSGSIFRSDDDGPEKTKHVVLGGGTHNTDGTPVNPDPAASATTNGRDKPTGPAAAAPDQPAPGQCQAPELACSSLKPDERTKLIGEFRNDGASNYCIAGGYASQYDSPKKRVGKCKIPTELKLGPGSFKCGDPKKEGMCNPTLFCLGLKADDKLDQVRAKNAAIKKMLPDGYAEKFTALDGSTDKIKNIYYCVKRGQDMTEQCSQRMQEFIDGKNGVLQKGKNIGETYVACDPAKLKVSTALQDDWNSLREKTMGLYKGWCNNEKKQFTALFCTECKVFTERLMAVNSAAIGSACPQPQASAPGPGSPEAIREEPGAG